MDKLSSFQEIQNLIKTVKGYKKDFITNLFLDTEKINSWINKGQIKAVNIGETVFILREKPEFSYLFYCSSSIESLKIALSQLHIAKNEPQLVVDIIGKEPDLQTIVSIFRENGFYLYTNLIRMSRGSNDEIYTNTSQKIILADKSDSSTIYNLLHQYFDPIAEQLPEQKEIENWIRLNHILLMVDRDEIQGFVIFDIIGITSYLRYWFVHPLHRNKKVGSALLNEYFNNSKSTKRQLFWVIQSNTNAIKRYLHYGFRPENLHDFIMTNKNITYETANN